MNLNAPLCTPPNSLDHASLQSRLQSLDERNEIADDDPDATIMIDLDRTISVPPPPSNAQPSGSADSLGNVSCEADVDGPRSVTAEEIDGPNNWSNWVQPQGTSTNRVAVARWRAGLSPSPRPPSSPQVVLPLHSECTSKEDSNGVQQNEVAGAAAIAALATFVQELVGLGSSLASKLPILQQWRSVLPAVCAVLFGLICRFVSVRRPEADGASPPAPEAELGL